MTMGYHHWTIGLFLIQILYNNFCSCQSSQSFDDSALPSPRAYTPDVGLLDFVYHNHDEMTRFLRFVWLMSVNVATSFYMILMSMVNVFLQNDKR